MSKFLFSIIVVLSVSSALAGTHGGGVLAVAASKFGDLQSNPEVVFHIGETDNTVKFAYGQLVNGQWQVQKLEFPTADIQGDLQAVKALELSKNSKTWVSIK